MGQKVHPVGFRLGSFRSWDSRWFSKRFYAENVLEDIKVRALVSKNVNFVDVAQIEIEKPGKDLKLIIHSSRPGGVIGKGGQGIERLKEDIAKQTGKVVSIDVTEIKTPESNATLVGKMIAEQIERRVSFKKLLRRAGFSAIRAGARGIKICLSGRLGGAEIARSEWLRLGSVPLHTLRSNIDYALCEAQTIYGKIGVKVWIYKGTF